jgi:hypothetical protein
LQQQQQQQQLFLPFPLFANKEWKKIKILDDEIKVKHIKWYEKIWHSNENMY